jgi:hypothetical protein
MIVFACGQYVVTCRWFGFYAIIFTQTQMHTALIFKEQVGLKEPGLRKKGLSQPHYSIQHTEGYDQFCFKDD